MKIKHFILFAMCSLLCMTGCSILGNSQDSSSATAPESSNESSSSSSSSQEEIVIPQVPVVSVNQDSVEICVGESYTLTAAAENIQAPAFVWSIDGDFPSDVVSLSQEGNVATVTALKTGETKLVASLEYEGHTYFRSVSVTVKEDSGITLVLSDNVGFDAKGYHVDLSTLTTENGDETSIVPLVTAYKNNKIIAMDSFTWNSENASVVATEGNKFVSVSEGETDVVGVCEIDGKEYSVNVSVTVYRPTIALNESFVVEVENLSTFTLEANVKGIARGVLYNGQSVGEFNTQDKTITFDKDKLPKTAALLGENRELRVETSLASYVIKADLYTKIISNKEEFDGMAALAKAACSTDAAIWDGYFVLDNDIEYNGLFTSKIADLDSLWAAVEGNWFNGGLYGFKGIFDGKGHKIDGISIDNGEQIGSIFGVLHIDGVIKNVSFTNASVAANSSLVCGAGGGSIENIYIEYTSMGKGTQHYEGDGSINTHCASFFGFKEPTATANVSNCVIDVTKASFNTNNSIKIVGSEYASIKNVFVIGGTSALHKKSNATLAFSSVIDFVESTNAQGRYKKFDEAFWSLISGVPVSKRVYEDIYNREINFTAATEILVSGTEYKFLLDNNYARITTNNANVAIQSGKAIVSDTVTDGEEITVTATSLFDPTKTDTFTCKLAMANYEALVDLTSEAGNAFYDITLDKVYFADLASKIDGEVLYFVDSEYQVPTFGQDGDAAQTLIAVTKNKFYKFNSQSVTKVIATAEDLHYVRRDYTVSSYGNPGCYDSILKGTFVLINDIDCTGLELPNTGRYWENSRGFSGTFDGRGYTISNLKVGVNGLFGTLSYATIKNVNFKNVKMEAGDQGAYVSLFATRAFNSVIENVSMHFAEYIAGTSVYHTSGLMIYETSFDCQFIGITIDVSDVSGVKYVAECFYGADIPFKSEEKSTYSDITVIVASLDEVPVFAYNGATGNAGDIVAYPDGVTVQDVNGNVKA